MSSSQRSMVCLPFCCPLPGWAQPLAGDHLHLADVTKQPELLLHCCVLKCLFCTDYLWSSDFWHVPANWPQTIVHKISLQRSASSCVGLLEDPCLCHIQQECKHVQLEQLDFCALGESAVPPTSIRPSKVPCTRNIALTAVPADVDSQVN